MIHYEPGDAIFAEGPWTHRDVSANGARFHVAEAGNGPLVLLVHGFPTFWWMWKDLLVELAQNGYRAVAMDLRGYGGSDHPPRGYDLYTASRDISAVIRSLGMRNATLIGHGFGGLLAWSTTALYGDVVDRLVAVSAAHPNCLRDAILNDRAQRRASAFAFGFQRPWIPERQLVADDAAKVAKFLRRGSAKTDWLTDDVAARYRGAFQSSNTAHCAVEYYRWMLRSIPRPDGRQFAADVAKSHIKAPVLQLHGALDDTVLPTTARGSDAYVDGSYKWHLLSGLGHYLPEEDPTRVNQLILEWLANDPQ